MPRADAAGLDPLKKRPRNFALDASRVSPEACTSCPGPSLALCEGQAPCLNPRRLLFTDEQLSARNAQRAIK